MSKRAIFIDRDGTLIEHYDYLTEVNQVKLYPRAASALKLLRERGFVLVLITNQSAVARGMLTEKKLSEIHDHLKALLNREGAFLDKIYYCPYHPEAPLENYRQDSDLRKPKPGMLLKAAQELDIDLSQSWMIGDDDRDILAGHAAGCRSIMIENRGSGLVRKGDSKPDFIAVNLQEAANMIVRYSDVDTTDKKEPPTAPVEQEDQPEPENTPTSIQEEVSTSEVSEPEPVKIEKPELPAITEPVQQDKEPYPRKKKKRRKLRESPPEEISPVTNQDDSVPLLKQILRELQTANREKTHETDFSFSMLFAAITQMIVVLCIVLFFKFSNGPESDQLLSQNCLLLGVIFQVFTLTLVMFNRSH